MQAPSPPAMAHGVPKLGAELARGGEGVIHLIQGRPEIVAKVYHKPPSPEKIEKLRQAIAIGTDQLRHVAAWPLALLEDLQGRLLGFAMPKVGAGANAHELYSPKSRTTAFPEADFRFIVHVATNIARAYEVVHAHGCVIGDINHGHLLVGHDGRVVIIDCDSFQISSASRTYTCDVGVPLFTAPELQGRNFRGLLRTPNHDNFGLAVLLFHLLMMGRHPYAGVWSGRQDLSIEKAIAENRFAYGVARHQFGMEQPPATLALSDLGVGIAALFESAFAPHTTHPRPTGLHWVRVLVDLAANLKQCDRTVAHHFPQAVIACPWCKVEGLTGVRLFGQRIRVGPSPSAITVEELWRSIEAITPPPPDPPLPGTADMGASVAPLSRSGIAKLFRKAAAVIAPMAGALISGSIGFMIGLVLAVVTWPRVSAERRKLAQARVQNAEHQWAALRDRWHKEASEGTFAAKRLELERVRTELLGLPAFRTKLQSELSTKREHYQRIQYLDRFRIESGNVDGIGPGRAAKLSSFGIETAADISEKSIRQVWPNSEVLLHNLIGWRRRHEANFRFNSAVPVDPRELSRIESEVAARLVALTERLKKGPRELAAVRANILAARVRLQPILDRTATELREARHGWQSL